MKRKNYPEFHKALLDPAIYPDVSRKIKFVETASSFIYLTGHDAYKISKPSKIFSSLAIKEAFAHESLTLGKRWAPHLDFEMLPIIPAPEDAYRLGGDGEPVDYAMRLTQLSNQHWVDHLIGNGRLTSAIVGRMARFLAVLHTEFPAPPDKGEHAGRPEHFRELFEEIVYQSKKYAPTTVTEPILDTVTRAINRYLDNARRIFARRIKKQRIVDGHGAFIPEHIHVRGKEIAAVSVLDGQDKYRVMDAANDVASLINELQRADLADEVQIFVKRYATAAKDRDLEKVLPAYRTFQSMRSGLLLSERIAEGIDDDEMKATLISRAQFYYNAAVSFAREIPQE